MCLGGLVLCTLNSPKIYLKLTAPIKALLKLASRLAGVVSEPRVL